MNRALATSDLSVSDLTAEIAIDLPKKWNERFKSKATFKRVNKALADSTDETSSDGDSDEGGSTGNGSGSGSGSSDGGNSGSQTSTVAAPTISGNTSFAESTLVTMSAEAGAEIRYTTDGSTPTAESSLYSEALTLSATTTVKAVAIKDGVSSEVTSKTFTKSTGGDDSE